MHSQTLTHFICYDAIPDTYTAINLPKTPQKNIKEKNDTKVKSTSCIVYIRSYIRSKDSGCEVVDDKKRKKIFKKIKKFTSEKSFILALLGIVGLAISVNVIELACSAGLPLVFTQILALNKVVGFKAFIYTLVYIVFFLLDDMIVFSIAMYAKEITAISTKYNKYSHLVGGILMLLIGVLLLFKPGWLMFNFS